MPGLPHKHPLLLLRDIERRARQQALGLPLQLDVRQTWSGVAFKLADAHLVAPLTQVREILPYPALSPVPGAKAWVKGIANVRGSLLPIMHLQSYLGRATDLIGRRSRVLVVRQGAVFAGLVVDEVFGMKHFVEEEYRAALPPGVDDRISAYLEGGYIQDGQWWGVFSMPRLVQSPQFLQVAS
ncbi:MAG: chemotaxis protein CheW [Pseudomonadota bacterium]